MSNKIYWVDYKNPQGFDRDCHILAENPQEALHKFNMEYGMMEITDFIDTTMSDNWVNVLDEVFA